MNTKLKISIAIIVMTLILFVPLMFNQTVYADEEQVRNRVLLIESDVDPRVAADNLSVTLMFQDERTGALEIITLTDAGGYREKVQIYASDFTLLSGMVHNDLVGDYIVECGDFNTFTATTTIHVVIGNPNYSGVVIDNPDNIVGFIDREATDELRKQHGLPPIDWDEVDRYAQENLEKVPEFFEAINKYLQEEKQQDKEKEEYRQEQEKLEQESQNPTQPNVTNPTNPDGTTQPTETPTPTIPTEQEIEKEKSTNFAIWFVILTVVIIVLVLYTRYKNNYFKE